MKDKNLRKMLMGSNSPSWKLEKGFSRETTITIPGIGDEERNIIASYRSDDGLIAYFLKRLQKIEDRLYKLEPNDFFYFGSKDKVKTKRVKIK